MSDAQVGWITAIVIGGLAGWLAELFMKSVAGAIFSFFGVNVGGWLGYLIAGFIGACLLIWIVRSIRAIRAI